MSRALKQKLTLAARAKIGTTITNFYLFYSPLATISPTFLALSPINLQLFPIATLLTPGVNISITTSPLKLYRFL
jgi:hypothetical protein